MNVNYASHCSYRIRYHMVFVVKYRKDLITHMIFNHIKEILMGISKRYYLEFHAIGSDGDHLHILVESAPRYSPSKVMQICKSITAKQLFIRCPNLKDALWGGHFWTEGGHVDTIGDGYDANKMEKYIKNQGVDKEQLKIYQFSPAP